MMQSYFENNSAYSWVSGSYWRVSTNKGYRGKAGLNYTKIKSRRNAIDHCQSLNAGVPSEGQGGISFLYFFVLVLGVPALNSEASGKITGILILSILEGKIPYRKGERNHVVIFCFWFSCSEGKWGAPVPSLLHYWTNMRLCWNQETAVWPRQAAHSLS